MSGGAPGLRVERALARIAARDDLVRAWTHVDAPGAVRAAGVMRDDAPLAGLLLGVKDIVDVAGLPCGCGSPIYRQHVPPVDAALVALLRHLGAIVLGKTATTELAFLAPAATRNPLAPSRSPGGSSSGSAAAVADGHVDAALATQTSGSIARPAAFCGVVGFKPTRGRFSLAGVRTISPSLDTIGWIARDVATASRLHAALTEDRTIAPAGRLGFCRTAAWPAASPDMQEAVQSAARALGAAEVPPPRVDLDAAHATVMRFEMRRELAAERLGHRDALSPVLRDFLEGEIVGEPAYRDAREIARGFDVDGFFGAHEILLTPSAAGEAVPFGSTGDPAFSRAVTLLGLPSVTLPFARGTHGLPLGLQLIGRPHTDAAVLATAAELERGFGFGLAIHDGQEGRQNMPVVATE